jgi:hypothetical protein
MPDEACGSRLFIENESVIVLMDDRAGRAAIKALPLATPSMLRNDLNPSIPSIICYCDQTAKPGGLLLHTMDDQLREQLLRIRPAAPPSGPTGADLARRLHATADHQAAAIADASIEVPKQSAVG